jgi:Predicted carboxypeptidase
MTEFNKERIMIDYSEPLTRSLLMDYLELFARRYDYMELSYIGTTLLGKGIPMVRLGDAGADRAVLYVGAHHGMEWITSVLLLRFINEYCESYQNNRRMYNINIQYLFKSRQIFIVPMLNPDGCDLQINGLLPTNPIRDRVLKMNGGSGDFSRWQANGRGVDLNHNYDAGFAEYKKIEAENGINGGAPTRFSGEHPESEPETAALCNFLRFNDVKMILTLHTQGEEIYYTSGETTAPRSAAIGNLIAKMTGYTLASPEGMAAYGGLTDWYIKEFNRPSFTIECGKGTNPLPLSHNFKIYSRIREALFTAPILI